MALQIMPQQRDPLVDSFTLGLELSQRRQEMAQQSRMLDIREAALREEARQADMRYEGLSRQLSIMEAEEEREAEKFKSIKPYLDDIARNEVVRAELENEELHISNLTSELALTELEKTSNARVASQLEQLDGERLEAFFSNFQQEIKAGKDIARGVQDMLRGPWANYKTAQMRVNNYAAQGIEIPPELQEAYDKASDDYSRAREKAKSWTSDRLESTPELGFVVDIMLDNPETSLEEMASLAVSAMSEPELISYGRSIIANAAGVGFGESIDMSKVIESVHEREDFWSELARSLGHPTDTGSLVELAMEIMSMGRPVNHAMASTAVEYQIGGPTPEVRGPEPRPEPSVVEGEKPHKPEAERLDLSRTPYIGDWLQDTYDLIAPKVKEHENAKEWFFDQSPKIQREILWGTIKGIGKDFSDSAVGLLQWVGNTSKSLAELAGVPRSEAIDSTIEDLPDIDKETLRELNERSKPTLSDKELKDFVEEASGEVQRRVREGKEEPVKSTVEEELQRGRRWWELPSAWR